MRRDDAATVAAGTITFGHESSSVASLASAVDGVETLARRLGA